MRMADVKEPVKKTVERPAEKPAESKYSVAELTAAAAGVFKTTPDVVKTALKLDGKDAYTLKEAEKVVAAFGGKTIK